MRLPSEGGIQNTKIIPRPDVYRLIAKSKLPAAERFENLIFEEVLPSIHKTGMYLTPEKQIEPLTDTRAVDEMLTRFVEECPKSDWNRRTPRRLPHPGQQVKFGRKPQIDHLTDKHQWSG
ncbi:BRO family, N-terminal domain [Algoriphagus hitonicola]|uniref:BRO family, N-terminal domain n=1 Tax=Algoriphagus hitonicola TaxID=435880 RepID=A0A1I2V5M4_9BACT|nr:BRO family, N-terminal domain [Algoriphagus hitonicola]